MRYSYTTCTDVFDYEFVNDDNKKIKFTAKEKRVLTFNPTLCRKQQREINKLYEKAKILKAGQAKKSEYGESSKYVKFASTDKEGNVTKEKVAVALDEKKYEKDMALAGYNLLVTSEIKMKDQEYLRNIPQFMADRAIFPDHEERVGSTPCLLQNRKHDQRAFSDLLFGRTISKDTRIQSIEASDQFYKAL